jgi:N-acetylmuramic acid 6-phosphate etherase
MTSQPDFFVVGVDGGASKTMAVVMDQGGQILGRGQSGASNIHTAGLDLTKQNLLAAMNAAVEQAGVELNRAAAVTWALAGTGQPTDRSMVKGIAAEILPDIPVQIENDAVAALMGGLGSRQGVVLIAGTGMIAYGENQARSARAGGWGYFLDQGSAYDLAKQALQALVQSADGLHFPARLTERILKRLGLSQPGDIVGWVYNSLPEPASIAALAPLVLEEAQAGDMAAIGVLASGAEALAAAVEAVTNRLELGSNPFNLVLAGGLMQNLFYRQVVIQAICTRIPGANPSLPRSDAATGAGLLALVFAGHKPTDLVADMPSGGVPYGWTTEQRNVLTLDLDLYSTSTIVGLMHLQDQQAVLAVGRTLSAITDTVEQITQRMAHGGRLIYVGAGSPGRLGIVDAAECVPTFNCEPSQVVGVIAGGSQAITHSVEGAEDHAEEGSRAILNLKVGELDSVVGISASGRTPFVLGAMAEARQQGALTIALVNNLPSPLTELADLVIAPLTGPEAVTGSTRLKAGTAQKLVLNMLSTAVMVRLGKTYGNLMVDLRTTNNKLRGRARRMVCQAAGISEEAAAEALDASGGDVKTAIVSILRGCTPAEASLSLIRAGGKIRQALQDG